MTLHRTEGIVLKNALYGEADLLVTFLTLDYGIINTFAKSPRKIKSRFGSSLEPLTYSRISFWGREDSRLPRLTQSDIINPFQKLRESLDCMLRLSGMMELTLSFLPEGEANRKVFFLLKQVMEMMLGGCSRLNTVLYRIRFLELTGYAPGLKGCARCGGGGQGFYMSQGSIVCDKCIKRLNIDKAAGGNGKKGFVTLSPGSIKLYEALSTWDLSKMKRIRASASMLMELFGMLEEHIEYRLSRPLKTKGTYVPFKTGYQEKQGIDAGIKGK